MTVSKLTDVMNILRTDFYYYFKDKDDVMIPVKEYFYRIVEQNGEPSNVSEALTRLFSNILTKNKPKTRQFFIDIASNYSPLCVSTFTGLLNEKYGSGNESIVDNLTTNSKLRTIAELTLKYFSKEIDKETALELLK